MAGNFCATADTPKKLQTVLQVNVNDARFAIFGLRAFFAELIAEKALSDTMVKMLEGKNATIHLNHAYFAGVNALVADGRLTVPHLVTVLYFNIFLWHSDDFKSFGDTLMMMDSLELVGDAHGDLAVIDRLT